MPNTQTPHVYRDTSLLLRLLRSRESGVFLAFILLFAILALARPYSFLTYLNLTNLGTQIAFIAISGIGVLLVILTSGVDLSLGSSSGLSGFVCAIAVVLTPNPYLGLLTGLAAALLTGAIIGALNGAVISYLRVTPFIVTLGMMWIARSIIYVLGRQVVANVLTPSDHRLDSPMPVTNIPQLFVHAGSGSLMGVPVPIFVLLVLAVAVHILLSHTILGRQLYAIGGNAEAARYAGIRVEWVRFLAYVLCSTICGITGFLYVSRFNAGTLDAGKNDELQAIAAAVIGGTSLMGGTGSVAGVILGACVMGVVSNGMDTLHIPAEPKLGIIGAVIIAAAIIDILRSRRL